MILKLKYFFAFAAMTVAFASCSKELSYEGGAITGNGNTAGTAIFTFTGEPNSCASAVVSGTYKKDTALNSADNVVISITVDSTGSYSVSTSTVDGITFSTIGTFTTKGTQNITLTATGKPTAAGTFSFSPGANGCSFSVTVTTADTTSGNPVPPVTPTDFLTANIGGSFTTFYNSITGQLVSQSGLSSLSIDGSNDTTNATFIIELGNTGNIVPGTYTVITATNISPMFGSVVYSDGSGGTWGPGVSNQPGTFSIVITAISATSVSGTFSGTLYSSSGTGSTSKVVSNGQFTAPLQ